MKVLLLLVVLVAAFEANCRVNTDGPDGPDLNNLLSELEKPQTYDVDHQMKKDLNEKNQIKLRGKAETRIIKKVLENLKTMKEELTQANTEMKMELQDIINYQDNNTQMNTEMKRELQDIINYQDNNTQMNTEMKMELQDIINYQDNNTQMNTEMKMELQDIINYQDNNTQMNTEMKMELKSMKENLGNMTTKLDLIIDSIGYKSVYRECPRDMFLFGPSNGRQCFKYFGDSKRTWAAADQKCRDENLVLAETNDPTSLRAYLISNYNPNDWTYLGARGDGSSQRWVRSGAALSNTSPLWYPGSSGSRVTTADYLLLVTTQNHLDSHPTKPYYATLPSLTLPTRVQLPCTRFASW